MQAVTYSTFKSHLKEYMQKANEDADQILVTSRNPDDNIVVMSERDYNSWMETMRIYENPALAEKIRKGMQQVREGRTQSHDLIEA